MSVSYKKLWKLLIDKDMKKKDLCEKAGISPASVTKMGRNGHVTTEILVKRGVEHRRRLNGCTAIDKENIFQDPDRKSSGTGHIGLSRCLCLMADILL